MVKNIRKTIKKVKKGTKEFKVIKHVTPILLTLSILFNLFSFIFTGNGIITYGMEELEVNSINNTTNSMDDSNKLHDAREIETNDSNKAINEMDGTSTSTNIDLNNLSEENNRGNNETTTTTQSAETLINDPINLDNKYNFTIFFTSNLHGDNKVTYNELNNYFSQNNASLVIDTGNFSNFENHYYESYLNNVIYNHINITSEEAKLGLSYLESLKSTLVNKNLLSSCLIDASGNYLFNQFAVEKINIKDSTFINLALISLIDEKSKAISNEEVKIKPLNEAYNDALTNLNSSYNYDLLGVIYDGAYDDTLINFISNNSDIDIIILNNNEPINTILNGTYVLSTGAFLNYIGKIKLDFTLNQDSTLNNTYIETNIIDTNNIPTYSMDNSSTSKESSFSENFLDKKIEIQDDLNTSSKDDSSLPDLINTAYYSHALGFLGNVNNIVSMCNVKIKNYSILKGSYSLKEIEGLFFEDDHPVIITLPCDVFLKIINNSYNNLPKTAIQSSFNLGDGFPLSNFDFYENISFNINPNNDKDKRIENLSYISDNYINFNDPSNSIYLITTKEKINTLIQEKILSEDILSSNSLIWDPNLTTKDLVVNYLSTLEDGIYYPYTNNNWSIRIPSLNNFEELKGNKNIENKNEIKRNYDLESPTGQFILTSLMEEKSADVAMIKKDDLKDSLNKGVVNKESIKNLTNKSLGLIRTNISGRELKDVVSNDFIKDNSIEVSGLKGTYYTDENNERKLSNLTFNNDEEIIDEENYNVLLASSDNEASIEPLNDVLAQNISKKEEINYSHNPNFKEGPKLMMAMSEGEVKEKKDDSSNNSNNKLKISTKPKDKKDSNNGTSFSEKYALKDTNSSNTLNSDLIGKKGKNALLPNAGSIINVKIIYLGILLFLIAGFILKSKKKDIT